MSHDLRAAGTPSRGTPTSPDQTLKVACALIADTTNGVSSVKVERVTLDGTIERLLRAVEDHPDVRLVLRPAQVAGEADLVIEQAIAPIHFEEPRPSSWLGRLSFLRPRRQQSRSSGRTSAPPSATTATMRELR